MPSIPRREFVGGLCAAAVLTACAPARVHRAEGSPEPVVLNVVSGFPSKHSNNEGFWMFKERLQQRAPWITLRFRGGPEVMAPDVLAEGVSTGAFDVATLPADYYVDQMPAMDLPRFTPFTPMEERRNGIQSVYDEMHRDRLGVVYLGHTVSGIPQVVLLKNQLDTLDLGGRPVRTSAATTDVVAAMNGVPVSLPGNEVYTALERNVVAGAAWAAVGPSALGLPDVVGYHLSPRFYESLANVIVNEDAWNRLDRASRTALTETMAEVEPTIFEHYRSTAVTEMAEWAAQGVHENTLPEEDALRVLEIAYRECWNDLDWDAILRTSPKAQRIREVYEKEFAGELFDVVPGGARVSRTGTSEGGKDS